MNDKQREAAARQLCELRGIDPEKLVGHGAPIGPDGFAPAVLLYSPAWKLALAEIRDREALDAAMEAGRAA